MKIYTFVRIGPDGPISPSIIAIELTQKPLDPKDPNVISLNVSKEGTNGFNTIPAAFNIHGFGDEETLSCNANEYQIPSYYRSHGEWFFDRNEAYATAERIRQKQIAEITQTMSRLSQELMRLTNMSLNPNSCQENVFKAQLGHIYCSLEREKELLNLLQAEETIGQNNND